MTIAREPTMTILCKACGHQYGAWRPRCTACGETTPAAPAPPRRVATRREPAASACIFCHQRKADTRCPHCDERVHRTCQELHTPECVRFQEGRADAIARLSK